MKCLVWAASRRIAQRLRCGRRAKTIPYQPWKTVSFVGTLQSSPLSLQLSISDLQHRPQPIKRPQIHQVSHFLHLPHPLEPSTPPPVVCFPSLALLFVLPLRVCCQRSAVRRLPFALPRLSFVPQLPSFKAPQSPTTTITSYPGKLDLSIRTMRSRFPVFFHSLSCCPPSTLILRTCPTAFFTNPLTFCAHLPTIRLGAFIQSITLYTSSFGSYEPFNANSSLPHPDIPTSGAAGVCPIRSGLPPGTADKPHLDRPPPRYESRGCTPSTSASRAPINTCNGLEIARGGRKHTYITSGVNILARQSFR